MTRSKKNFAPAPLKDKYMRFHCPSYAQPTIAAREQQSAQRPVTDVEHYSPEAIPILIVGLLWALSFKQLFTPGSRKHFFTYQCCACFILSLVDVAPPPGDLTYLAMLVDKVIAISDGLQFLVVLLVLPLGLVLGEVAWHMSSHVRPRRARKGFNELHSQVQNVLGSTCNAQLVAYNSKLDDGRASKESVNKVDHSLKSQRTIPPAQKSQASNEADDSWKGEWNRPWATLGLSYALKERERNIFSESSTHKEEEDIWVEDLNGAVPSYEAPKSASQARKTPPNITLGRRFKVRKPKRELRIKNLYSTLQIPTITEADKRELEIQNLVRKTF